MKYFDGLTSFCPDHAMNMIPETGLSILLSLQSECVSTRIKSTSAAIIGDHAMRVTKQKKSSHCATHQIKARRNGAVTAPAISVTLRELGATMMIVMEKQRTKGKDRVCSLFEINLALGNILDGGFDETDIFPTGAT
jgi:hypothetical protein